MEEGNRGIIVQIVENSLLDLPGILEEVVRSEITEEKLTKIGSTDYAQYSAHIRNMRFARCKIRKEISQGKIVDWTGYSPSRDSKITKTAERDILQAIMGSSFKHPILLGQDSSAKDVSISAFDMQGLTLIVGRKGMGKSHVAKSLLLGLLANGANCLVFDINDEYTKLGESANGKKHPTFGSAVEVRRPGQDLKFTLPYMTQEVFLKVLEAIGVAEASMYQVRDMWENMVQEDSLSFTKLLNDVGAITDNRIRGALQRRLRFLQGTHIVTDTAEDSAPLEGFFQSNATKKRHGQALIISLKGLDRVIVRSTVQTVLARLQMLLENRGLLPMFVFAEEAHLYLDDTDWIEAVTRMRHLGMFQVYMTNTPARVPNLIIRQVDNLLMFHLDLEEDAKHVSPASRTDEVSTGLVARSLPARKFMAVGSITGDFPLQLSTIPLPTVAAGETLLRFSDR